MRAGRAVVLCASCLVVMAHPRPVLATPIPIVGAVPQIVKRLASCWRPPSEGDEITSRMSFRSNGALIGRPRITYLKAVDGADGEAALANSIFAAIQTCPLRFTPALGAAIAGRTFTIRFVAPRKTLRAAL